MKQLEMWPEMKGPEMASRKYLVIDTETGGTEPENHSLLSLAAVVCIDGAPIDSLYTLIKEPIMITTPEAMKVHGLQITDIENEGVTPGMAVVALEALMNKHDMKPRVTLAGHNVQFDVAFLKRLYRFAGKDFGKRFSYRPLCTMTAAMVLEHAGVISLPKGASLDALTAMYKIEINREGGHNALNDAWATALLLRSLTGELKRGRQ